MQSLRRCLALTLAAACALATTATYNAYEAASTVTARVSQVLRDARDWMVGLAAVAVSVVARAFAVAPGPSQVLALPLMAVQLRMRDYVLRRQREQKPCKRPMWSLCPSI
jgi:hypothetical protein